MPIYAVTGNHDVPIKPIPQIMDDVCDWYSMQNWLCNRDQAHQWELDGSGAYAVRFGEGEIIGLNAVTHWRRFAFPDGAQLDWLFIRHRTCSGILFCVMHRWPVIIRTIKMVNPRI